jgi:hypothetical protein
MGREVLTQELSESDALRDEFVERTSKETLAGLSTKIPHSAAEKQAAVC